jgi:DNA repair protein RadA/Sms
VAVSGLDVYALAVGGARVTDPGADAAIALAITSSLSGNAMDDDLVVVGEVGLGGELRRVAHLDRRLSEAARLGFRRAIVPSSDVEAPDGMEVLWAPTLSAAHAIARVGPA